MAAAVPFRHELVLLGGAEKAFWEAAGCLEEDLLRARKTTTTDAAPHQVTAPPMPMPENKVTMRTIRVTGNKVRVAAQVLLLAEGVLPSSGL